MLGAIIGDVIGSSFERHPTKNRRFSLWNEGTRFTDDTVMTLGTMSALLAGGFKIHTISKKNKECMYYPYKLAYQLFGKTYPNAGYGASFKEWINNPKSIPYKSWGNGSAMRVSPIGWFFNTEREVLREARKSAEVSHNHKEGIKGAQAIALAVFYARKGKSKIFIKEHIEKRFKYNLNRSTSDFKKSYKFDVSCQGSVPEAIICFLESKNYMDAVRRAVALGGDSDTLGAMTGSVAEAFYKQIPSEVVDIVMDNYFPENETHVLRLFYEEIGVELVKKNNVYKLITI